MTESVEGTVGLVTGASSGIGAATARALAAAGASVAIAARRADRLDTLAGEIRDGGGTALSIEADLTSAEQAADAVERTVSELGRLDTLINNAGVMLLGPAVGAPLEEWQRMLDVNIAGLLYCAHAALPHLLRAAENGPRQVAAQRHVRVSLVEPGAVETELRIAYIVTRPQRVAVNEMLIRPSEQAD